MVVTFFPRLTAPGFTLDDHIFGVTEIQSYWSKRSRLVKVIHDGSYLLRFELNKNQYIRTDQQKKQICYRMNQSHIKTKNKNKKQCYVSIKIQ